MPCRRWRSCEPWSRWFLESTAFEHALERVRRGRGGTVARQHGRSAGTLPRPARAGPPPRGGRRPRDRRSRPRPVSRHDSRHPRPRAVGDPLGVRRVRVRRRWPDRSTARAVQAGAPGPPRRGGPDARRRPPADGCVRPADRRGCATGGGCRPVHAAPRARPGARPRHDPHRPPAPRARHRTRGKRACDDRSSRVRPRRKRDGRRLMPRRTCDGASFLAAFRSAVASLEANVDEINSLNVFPVPDGDTGTNMLATVRAALEEADKAGLDADADRVAHAASFGALMGARGNSGVITSQILAGMAQGLQGKRRFNGLDLAFALDAGTKTAYKAVAKPVEGTILTVIREASAAAVAAAERDNNVEAVLAATVDAAERAVAKTPSLLPILREAHVVDSGGQGLLRMFQGALEAARGRPVDAVAGAAVATDAPRDAAERRTDHVAPGVETGEYGYETVYLLRARDGTPLDIPAIQRHLEGIGDSVLVAGDPAMAKIH